MTSYHAEHAFSYIGLGSYRRLGYRQRTLHIIGMYVGRISFKGAGGAFASLGSDLPALSFKSYDFGVVRIKRPIASGGLHPPDPLFQRCTKCVYYEIKSTCILGWINNTLDAKTLRS